VDVVRLKHAAGTGTYTACPIRISWWEEDRSPAERFVVSLIDKGDGKDMVLVDPYGRVIAQPSLESLHTRSADLGYELEVDGEQLFVDFVNVRDRVREWPDADDCDAILNAWNLLDEVCRSINKPLGFRGKEAERAYNKVFRGTGILTPDTTDPIEPWLSPRLQGKTLQVLDEGLRRFKRHIGAGRDSLFEAVTAIVNDEDPVGLLDIAPYYEYEPEVEDLMTLGDLLTASTIQQVFVKWFTDDYVNVPMAERIHARIRCLEH